MKHLMVRYLLSIFYEDPSIFGLGEVSMKLAKSIHPGDTVMRLRLKDKEKPKVYHMIVGLLEVKVDHVVELFETWHNACNNEGDREHEMALAGSTIGMRVHRFVSIFQEKYPLHFFELQYLSTSPLKEVCPVFVSLKNKKYYERGQ
jgi:hypothetical protein